MQIAQKLYEGLSLGDETVGLITYMRTDGVQMAPEAINAARSSIAKQYGDKYVPDSPAFTKQKPKCTRRRTKPSAQQIYAHTCRSTQICRR